MYRLTPEQQRIVQRIAALADQHVAPHASRIDRDGAFVRESIAALAEHGILGLTVPVEFGGMGQGLRTMAAAVDEIAQRCASTAMVYLMHLCGVACYGAARDKTARYLQAAARGEHLSTLAFSEPGSRSHFWARSAARRQPTALRASARRNRSSRPPDTPTATSSRRSTRPRRSRSRARSTSCSAPIAAWRHRASGTAPECGETPARR